MKTVGIIGGLGPDTTAEFYLEIISSSFKRNKINRPPILIWNVPLIYRIEEDLITHAIGEDRYIPFLVDAAKQLEKAGADFLVIPCNSVHIFIEEIRNAVSIPVLSIVEETALFLKNRNIKEIALLATSTTINKKLYNTKLQQNDINFKLPTNDEQIQINELINNLVNGTIQDADRNALLQIINNFQKNEVKTMLLACTDLQLIAPKHDGMQIVDTMKVLVEATINNILAK